MLYYLKEWEKWKSTNNMKKLLFKPSATVSLGVEFELQIINPNTYALVPRAKDLIRNIKESSFQERISPEITQSMIELNSSIHQNPKTLYQELIKIQQFLNSEGKKLGVAFCGGGTHPFQRWTMLKIFPSPRYKKISRIYKYLSKRSTVFGQHVHIGCKDGEEALYLTHALARYVPHLITIAASSPYYQGVDTHYQSARVTVFNSFPLSGVIPYLTTWEEFSAYFYKMKNLGIIQSMKDFYWDIRPKPEFGTVEVRVCDMPLTSKKAVMIAAYLQSLAYYLLKEKPFTISTDFYHVYNYNRFQACRFGYEGKIITQDTLQPRLILDDIVTTIKTIEHHANELNNMPYLSLLLKEVLNKKNDSSSLRQIYLQKNSLSKLVHEQCKIWSEELIREGNHERESVEKK